MHSLLINSFFLFLVTVCFYDNTWYVQGDTFPCIDGCNTCICLGNNNVGSTHIDCCKLRSYVYLANLCDTLGKSRQVLNIWNLQSYILRVFVFFYSLYVCLCLFLLTCSCLTLYMYIYILQHNFFVKTEKKLFGFIISMLITCTCMVFVSKGPFAESLGTRVLVMPYL